MSAEIMSLFGPLSNPQTNQRISAACSIVSSLINTNQSIQKTQDDTEKIEDADFQYTIKRLIRGLASPTIGARLGFSVALTEILSKSPHVSAQSVYSLLISSTDNQGGMKSSEERDLLLGRLFGIKAMVSSGLIFRSSSDPDSQLKIWNSLVDDLDSLTHKRTWLAESAGWVLTCGMLQTLLADSEPIPWKETALKTLVKKIFLQNKSWNLEKLAMAILLQRSNVTIDWNPILCDILPVPSILSPENMSTLYALFTSSAPPSDLKSASNLATSHSASTPEPSTHPHFIHSIISFASSSISNGFSVFELYAQLLENYYFTPHESNPTRKCQGFNLLNDLIASNHLTQSDKPSLLTSATTYTLMVQLAAKDRLLHKTARSVTTTILDQAKQSPSLALGFATHIRKTLPNFDELSSTKTLETLLTFMTGEEVQSWVHELINALEFGKPNWSNHDKEDTSDDDQSPSDLIDDKFRQQTLSQLCNILYNGAIPKTRMCIRAIIYMIISCGFYGQLTNLWPSENSKASKRPKTKSEPANGMDSSTPSPNSAFFDLCRSRFYSCMSDLSCKATEVVTKVNKPNGPRQNKLTPISQAKEQPWNLEKRWTSEALEIMLHYESHGQQSLINGKKLQDEKHINELNRLRETTLKFRDTLNLSLKKVGGSEKVESLALLIESILLMSYDDHEDLLEALDLLLQLEPHCQEFLKNDVNQSNGFNSTTMDVLIETLLFFLSWPIGFIRNVVEQVFSNFTDCIEISSLQILIDQMIPSNSAYEDDMDEDEVSSEGESEERGSEDDSEASSSDNDHDDSDSISGSSLGSIDEAFRDEVATALANALAKDQEEEDSDASSEPVDDDEMLALDANLAALFQKRTGAVTTKVQNTQGLHLRLKLSELFSRFVKSKPNPLLTARLITPMLNLIRKPSSGEEELKKKVFKILTEILRQPITKLDEAQKKSNLLSPVEWFKIFKKTFLIAQRVEASDISKLCSQAILWLINLGNLHLSNFNLIETSNSTSIEFKELYETSLKEFCLKKNSRLQPKFFLGFFNKFSLIAWNLKESLLELFSSSETVNAYRRIQILNLLQSLMMAYATESSRHNDLLTFMPSVRTHLLNVLKQGISSSSVDETNKSIEKNMNTGKIKELLKVLMILIKLTIRLSKDQEESVRKVWSKVEIEGIFELVKFRNDLEDSKVLKKTFLKILNCLSFESYPDELKVDESLKKAKKMKKEKKEEVIEGLEEEEVEVEGNELIKRKVEKVEGLDDEDVEKEGKDRKVKKKKSNKKSNQ
ncbi:DNA polymerase phi-domain-containing protein [Melampsora americana]|nr:DNA polymerase phi-domain-containing protein [Melampsora americana]